MAAIRSTTLFQLLNVQVPFLFKYLVDHLNANPLALDGSETTMISLATALVLGCR